MRARLISICILGIILCGSFCCYSQTDSTIKTNSYTLNLYAIDLSEDMSMVSSKNDELLMLIYEKPNSAKTLAAPSHNSQFVLDTSIREKNIHPLPLKKSVYLIFLIERDDDRTVEQIDPVLRVYWEEIFKLYSKNDWKGLEKYLGDNDLLGYAELSMNDGAAKEVEFKSRQNLDAFHYKLKLSGSKK